jgi:fatty acid desaturase
MTTDYMVPKEFASANKETITSSAGVRYKDFRRTLSPKFGLLWLHIGLGYLAILLTAAGVALLTRISPGLPASIAIVACASTLFGYAVAFIQLFFHEAAHYNLAADKDRSDLLANTFIGALVGQDIKNYRPVHWGHHRFLGTVQDTEHTYFDPLDTKFIVESLFAVRVLKVLSGREQLAKTGDLAPEEQPRSMITGQLFIGLLLNGTLVLACVLTGHWMIALSWVIGMAIVFPFFASVRQVLEHRDENASPDVDYHTVAHGAINRLFGDGPLADTLGGAGFNRHLLHHWDPQLSYTRLKELENYLMDTELAPALQSRQTTYVRTFLRLFNA